MNNKRFAEWIEAFMHLEAFPFQSHQTRSLQRSCPLPRQQSLKLKEKCFKFSFMAQST